MRFLGLDLGTTFIKGAVLELETLAVAHPERRPFPEPIGGLPPMFREYDPSAIVAATRSLLEQLWRRAPDAAGLVLCSQLHSLVLTTPDGQPLSNVINWQDQRALQPGPDGDGSYFDALHRRLTPAERRELGNESRPGVPLCFLFWLAQQRRLPTSPAVATALPNFVVANLGGTAPKTDVTHAFGHGAFNVATRTWHWPVITKLGLDQVRWPEIVPQGTVVGEYRDGARRLPIFAPVGDYQCSQVGALLEEGELSINISTGSAVIQLARAGEQGDFQTRPWFDHRFLKTITHIPGGRALQALVRLLSELAAVQGRTLEDPWDYIMSEARKVTSTDLRLNPTFYFSALGDRGSLTNIREENLTVGHLFRAAFTGMADNYAQCAARVCPAKDWTRLVFSGGVALKTALLRRLICDRLGSAHRLAAAEEDTLLGLLVLARAFGGPGSSVADALAAARQHLTSS